MKTRHYISLVLIAVVLVAVVGYRLSAQPTTPKDDRGALGKYEQLVIPLLKSGQTNLVNQIVSMVSEMDAEKKTADIAMTVAILKDLRSGHTNEAISLLETQLDGALVGFDLALHKAGTEKIIEMTKKYREQFPRSTSNPDVDAGVARALNLNIRK